MIDTERNCLRTNGIMKSTINALAILFSFLCLAGKISVLDMILLLYPDNLNSGYSAPTGYVTL